ncbi:MAG: LytTR family DNA-binding domain-containing protein, partial [Bacteroidota bacterium]
MPKVLIIEDEPLAAKRLKRLLTELDPSIEILDVLDTVKSSVKWLSEQEAELIFLDIHLADGNSFSIFESVQPQTPIIFCTAYDQYALQAFRLNSIHYLLKPIEKEELSQALKKFQAQQQKAPSLDLQALTQAFEQSQKSYQQRFLVSSSDKIKSIPVEEVAYFFGQQKYAFLITHDKRRHIIDSTLGKLEQVLDPSIFFRINRQYIVKYEAIKNMYAHSKSRIKVELEPPGDIEAI